MVAALNDMPGGGCLAVDGTFYAFPNFQGVIDASPTLNNDLDLAEFLLKEAEVAMVPDRPSVWKAICALLCDQHEEPRTGHGAYCRLLKKELRRLP